MKALRDRIRSIDKEKRVTFMPGGLDSGLLEPGSGALGWRRNGRHVVVDERVWTVQHECLER